MRGILGLLCVLVPGLALAAPDANIVVDRGNSPGSKPAPLYVHFDGTTSTSSVGGDQVWRDLRFEWDFGDPASGSWATDGLSRNTDRGPVAGHVYESPGTYTVTLTVTDRNGATNQQQTSVTVDDPETVFASTTSCVSTSGTFTGCPAGATQVTSNDFDATMQSRVNTSGDRRVLFRRGEVFESSTSWSPPNTKTEGLVGAFGSGALPEIRMLAGNTNATVLLSGNSVNSASAGGWRFYQLRITSVGTTNQAPAFKTSFIFDDVLIYQSDIGPTGYAFNVNFDQSGLNVAHKHYAVVDTELRGNFGTPVTNPGSCWFGGADKTMVAGVNCGQANHWQMRIAYTNKAIISHNNVLFVGGAFEIIKFQCSLGGLNSVIGGVPHVCRHMVFANNLLATRLNVTAGGGADQGTIQDSVFERNMVQGPIQTDNPNDVFRHNVATHFELRSRISNPIMPTGNLIENNVCDGRFSGESCISIRKGGDAVNFDGLLARNNLAYATNNRPFFSTQSDASGTCTGCTEPTLSAQKNITRTTNPFVDASPDRYTRADFALPEGSTLINAGIAGIGAGHDLLGNVRPNGLPDVGAFEFQEAAPPPPECTIDAECDDNDQCTVDTCVANECSNTINSGGMCTDGNPSTENDVCSALGVCAGTPIPECDEDSDCNDGNQCHVATCTMGTCSNPNASNGTSCDDGNPANVNDVCTAGVCAGSAPTCDPACAASDQCNTRTCVAPGVCQLTLLTNATCNDGNAATTNDRCQAGSPSVCMGVAPPPPPPEGDPVPGQCRIDQIIDN